MKSGAVLVVWNCMGLPVKVLVAVNCCSSALPKFNVQYLESSERLQLYCTSTVMVVVKKTLVVSEILVVVVTVLVGDGNSVTSYGRDL